MEEKVKRPRGRPKGSKNTASVARQEQIARTGLTPLEFMLARMRDETADMRDRVYAANAAAPYVHPKLANFELGNKAGEVFRVMVDSGDNKVL